MSKKHYLSLDWIRGLGIILVVFGHSLSFNTASGINEDSFLRNVIYEWIYSFHMPLMFAVSGVTFAKYVFDDVSMDGKKACVKSKFLRLMVPYFSYGLVYTPFKILFSNFARKSTSWSEVWKIFLGENPNAALWFLYSLFVMMIITLFLVNRTNYKKWVLFFIVLTFLGTTHFSGVTIIYKSLQNYVWFLFGCGLGNDYETTRIKMENKARGIAETTVLGLLAFILMFAFDIKLLWPITAFFGVINCFGIAFLLEKQKRISPNNVISKLGKNTMCLYLFHNPIQVVVRTIAWRFLKWPYWITVALKFVGGLCRAILIQKVLIERSNILKLLFCGELKTQSK